MKKKFMLAMLTAVMIGLAGCGQDTPATEEAEVPVQETDLTQEAEDPAQEADLTQETEDPVLEIDPAVAEQLQDEIDQSLEDYDADVLREGYLDFSMELFRRSAAAGSNSMVSPTSVMIALDMAAAGANGGTQEQITKLFGEGVSQAQMERYCKDLLERYNGSEYVELHLANSVWINDVIAGQMKEEYLARTEHIFDAEAAVLPFDQAAVDAINSWCDEHTDGMIDHLISEIDETTVLYLINATALDAKWAQPYEDYQVTDETFTNAQGGVEDAKMLNYSDMYLDYFETEDATGFLKYYQGGEYAFLAILPEEGMSVDEYVQSLTGEKYEEFWNSRTQDYEVRTKLPEFTYEYELTMNDVLKDMGVTQAFQAGSADFMGIADVNLYISKVIHKTFIEVTQYGTRAAAVTSIAMDAASAILPEVEVKEVYLDRPFIYAIVEADTGIPLFIGTVQSVEN